MLFYMMDLLDAEVDKDIAKERKAALIYLSHPSEESIKAAGLRPGDRFAGPCDYSKTGWAKWFVSEINVPGCTCRSVPAPHIEPVAAETLSPAKPIAEDINQAPEAEGGEE